MQDEDRQVCYDCDFEEFHFVANDRGMAAPV
jgi:hypothetical protein